MHTKKDPTHPVAEYAGSRTEDALKAAFGNKMPPDFALAAKNLGITESELKEKLGVK